MVIDTANINLKSFRLTYYCKVYIVQWGPKESKSSYFTRQSTISIDLDNFSIDNRQSSIHLTVFVKSSRSLSEKLALSSSSYLAASGGPNRSTTPWQN